MSKLTSDQAHDLVESARVARLATVGADGSPHLVPIVFVVVGAAAKHSPQDTIYTAVDAKPKRTTRLRRIANIEANPAVCVLADSYSDDWDALWWVRADGQARVLQRSDAEAADALKRLARRYPQYSRQPPPGPVIAIDVQRWTGWRARDD